MMTDKPQEGYGLPEGVSACGCDSRPAGSNKPIMNSEHCDYPRADWLFIRDLLSPFVPRASAGIAEDARTAQPKQ